jgi:serine phosphatase RsbU (regulator of sigma subunit)/biotin operon repressor
MRAETMFDVSEISTAPGMPFANCRAKPRVLLRWLTIRRRATFMSTGRLLSALLMLQEHGRLTERELADGLEVSEGTVRRDLEALSAAGVPVFTGRGAQDVWQLDDNWRTQVPELDRVELRALLMTQTADGQLSAEAENALATLLPARSVSPHERAISIGQRLYVDPTGWHGTMEDLSMLPIVQDAVWRDRKLAFWYRTPGRERVERTVDPLGLVAKGSTWYLVARTSDGFRTYRVSRIEEAKLLDTPSERPADFDLALHWKSSMERFQDEVSRAVEARRRAAQDLEIAKQVQARLFPQSLPQLQTLEYAGICLQARHVGGDYYDFLDLGRGRLGIVLGDIAGKGIAAALLMANLQANLRSQCAIAFDQPQRFLRSVNQLFFENTTDSAYASLFFAEYDNATRRLRYANCGHHPALLLRSNDTLEMLHSTCTVVGAFKEWECSIEECQLFSGDALAIYTDGITESFNAVEEEFGEERLIEALRQHSQLSPQDMLTATISDVEKFSNAEQHDDLTLLIAKCR